MKMIEQHLEPSHVRETLIPIPDNIDNVRDIISQSKSSIRAKEVAYQRSVNALNGVESKLSELINL